MVVFTSQGSASTSQTSSAVAAARAYAEPAARRTSAYEQNVIRTTVVIGPPTESQNSAVPFTMRPHAPMNETALDHVGLGGVHRKVHIRKERRSEYPRPRSVRRRPASATSRRHQPRLSSVPL